MTPWFSDVAIARAWHQGRPAGGGGCCGPRSSRNDAIGNVAVIAAALGVSGSGTAWLDIVVGATLAALGVTGGWFILRQAGAELPQVSRQPADGESI